MTHRSKLSVLCLVSVVVQSDEVESGFNLIAAAAEHVISADALTSQLIAPAGQREVNDD